jgi:hypothetical protein
LLWLVSVRLLWLAFVLVAACDVEAPVGLGPACERETSVEPSAPRDALDVLLVVSDSRTMADVATEAGLRSIANELTVGGLPSVRVGVVGPQGFTTAPRDATCPPIDGDFLESEDLPWFWCDGGACRAANFSGELADALACIALPDAADAPAPLLERALRVLERGGFVRAGAALVVVLIAPEDDASPRPIAEYATRLRALHELEQ